MSTANQKPRWWLPLTARSGEAGRRQCPGNCTDNGFTRPDVILACWRWSDHSPGPAAVLPPPPHGKGAVPCGLSASCANARFGQGCPLARLPRIEPCHECRSRGSGLHLAGAAATRPGLAPDGAELGVWQVFVMSNLWCRGQPLAVVTRQPAARNGTKLRTVGNTTAPDQASRSAGTIRAAAGAPVEAMAPPVSRKHPRAVKRGLHLGRHVRKDGLRPPAGCHWAQYGASPHRDHACPPGEPASRRNAIGPLALNPFCEAIMHTTGVSAGRDSRCTRTSGWRHKFAPVQSRWAGDLPLCPA